MSLFTSFNSGVAGLQSAQSGLNTTSHNIANAKTKGYTRQQNIQTDAYYQTYKIAIDGSKMQIGMGDTVSAIRQIRDLFLDKEYRLEVGRQGFYEKLAETENEIEDIFGETEGVQFQNSLQKLWDVVEDLSTNPEEITNRELFISTAEEFMEASKNIYSSLETYQISLNTEIKDQVDRINEIGEQIAKYNLLIARAEASNVENANDYRDARNLLMDELGKYTNFTSAEDSDGSVQIYIDNAIFVADGLSYHMGCEKGVPTDMYTVVWLDNGYGEVYDLSEAYSTAKKTDVGSLRGILTARGNEIANYLDMPVEPQQADFIDADGNYNETAYKIAMNTYRDEVKNYNNTTGNSIITKIQAQFDQLVHGVVTTINDIFCPNVEADFDALTDENGATLDLSALTASTIQGDPFSMDSLSGNVKILDVNNCPVGTDDKETIGTEVFSRSQVDRYEIITLEQQIYTTDAEGNQVGLARDNGDGTYSLYLYNEENAEDIDWMYTLRSLEINPDLTADYSLLEVKANPSKGLTGAYDMELFPKLLTKWDEKFAVLDPNALASYTFDEYYTNMIGDLGTQGSVWQSMVEHQTSLTESVEDKRQQVAGVSTDEELVNLLMYQHAYNAASRYITTIDAMLQHLIERLG